MRPLLQAPVNHQPFIGIYMVGQKKVARSFVMHNVHEPCHVRSLRKNWYKTEQVKMLI